MTNDVMPRVGTPEYEALVEAERLKMAARQLAPHTPLASRAPLSLGGTQSETRHILDDIDAHFDTYIFSAGQYTSAIMTLWVASTHFMDQFETHPRLGITAPEKGSGKTTAMDHIRRLVKSPRKIDAGTTKAAIVEICRQKNTLLLDEIDKTLTPKIDAYGQVVAVFNSGYSSQGTTSIMRPIAGTSEWDLVEVNTFIPVVFSGIGNSLPDDALSRTIMVPLLKDRKGLAKRTNWRELDSTVLGYKERLESWAEGTQLPNYSEANLDPRCVGRLLDIYEPLKLVALAAGGKWPGIVDEFVTEELDRIEQEEAAGIGYESPHIALVKDLYYAFNHDDFVRTEELCQRLASINPIAWGSDNVKYPNGLSPKGLGAMLRNAYKIISTQVRIDGVKQRGFYRKTFEKIWETLDLVGPKLSEASVTSGASEATQQKESDMTEAEEAMQIRASRTEEEQRAAIKAARKAEYERKPAK